MRLLDLWWIRSISFQWTIKETCLGLRLGFWILFASNSVPRFFFDLGKGVIFFLSLSYHYRTSTIGRKQKTLLTRHMNFCFNTYDISYLLWIFQVKENYSKKHLYCIFTLWIYHSNSAKISASWNNKLKKHYASNEKLNNSICCRKK